jgi:hypothetical protein
LFDDKISVNQCNERSSAFPNRLVRPLILPSRRTENLTNDSSIGIYCSPFRSGGLLTAMVAEKRDRFIFVTNQGEIISQGQRQNKEGAWSWLNCVRAVVQAHGGTVTVTSKLQEGGCFKVRLSSIT